MRRRFVRQQESPAEREQLSIAVTGLGRDAGTTLVSTSLAIFYAEKGKSVTFTECCVPGRSCSFLYDAVAMEQRFYGRTFRDFYEIVLSGGRIRDLRNMERGVNWRIPLPQDRGLSETECRDIASQLTAGARDQVCIFDVQAGFDGFPVREMDALIAVADPLPSRLVNQAGQVARLLQMAEDPDSPRVFIVVNKVNPGVNRRQVSSFFGGQVSAWLPAFDLKELYGDEFACRFHWENRVIRKELGDFFTKFSHNL